MTKAPYGPNETVVEAAIAGMDKNTISTTVLGPGTAVVAAKGLS